MPRALIGSAKPSLPIFSNSFFPSQPRSPQLEPPLRADLHSEQARIIFKMRGVDCAAHMLSPQWFPSCNNSAKALLSAASASSRVLVAPLFLTGSSGCLQSLYRITMCRNLTLSMAGWCLSVLARFAGASERLLRTLTLGLLKKPAITVQSGPHSSSLCVCNAFATISPDTARGLCAKTRLISNISWTVTAFFTGVPVSRKKGSKSPQSICVLWTSGEEKDGDAEAAVKDVTAYSLPLP
mmetsp:Transcript_43818/g.115749  ORF Transcript_43818/g.115749 Transcript_43818/m.115749 type:complete len:239 (+) Transcript_43818:332-1048(+)